METHPEMTATLGVAAAFEVSWEPLSAEAKMLAGLLGLFAAAPVAWEWVQRACEQAAVLDEEALEDGQAALLRVNLLQKQGVQGELRYQVHPLVRESFGMKRADLAEAEALQRGFAKAMTDVAKAIPPVVTLDVRAWVVVAVPHFEEVTQRWTEVLSGGDKTWCCTGLSRFYESLSQWDEAEQSYKNALKISKEQLGDRHPDTASSLNNLALLYRSRGQYAAAEPLYVEALEICKTELGDRHPATATSLNNLALLYESQGQYAAAEPLYVEALEICKTELGDRHSVTATSLNNLAGLYRSQGRYAAAEPLYVEALEISKTELGDRHPDTAGSLFNFAALYYQTQRHQQALSYIQQALDIYVQKLGSEHPNTQAAHSWLLSIQQAIDGSA